MINTLIDSNIVIMSAISFLFLLWKTKSMQSSITTTVAILTVLVCAILVKLGMIFGSELLIISVMGIMVWRVIPHDNIDRWAKQ